MPREPLTDELTLAALDELTQPHGFALLGVAPAAPTEHEKSLRQWLSVGSHGEMAYLAAHLEKRLDVRELLPGARSIICVADRYPAQEAENRVNENNPATGRIARFAWGDDYHKTIKKRLFSLADVLRERFPEERFQSAVDTAPILEREHAARAGLGWIGKHTLLIHPRYGSYFLLGEIVTTLGVETTAQAGYPPATVTPDDHCGTCTRCIDACPTHCITPYQLDASRCISYLTIEHRGLIDTELHEEMGDWLAGSDVCQEVCPHNRDTQTTKAQGELPMPEGYTPRPPAPKLNLLEVLGWSPADRQRAFTRSALKRIKLEMLKRNALIAAGNYLRHQDAPALRLRITELSGDEQEHPLVRATAAAVLASLGSTR